MSLQVRPALSTVAVKESQTLALAALRAAMIAKSPKHLLPAAHAADKQEREEQEEQVTVKAAEREEQVAVKSVVALTLLMAPKGPVQLQPYLLQVQSQAYRSFLPPAAAGRGARDACTLLDQAQGT